MPEATSPIQFFPILCFPCAGVSLKLIQLLQHFDHLVHPVSNIVVTAVAKHSCKQVVLDVFREICSMDPSSLALDSNGAKSFASFLVLVSGQIPSAVLPTVPVLLPHLSGESTTFRSGVLGVLGELLKLLSGSDVKSDLLPDTRDEMLLKVMEHLYDVNAFVRVKVLNILLQLCLAQVSCGSDTVVVHGLPIYFNRLFLSLFFKDCWKE